MSDQTIDNSVADLRTGAGAIVPLGDPAVDEDVYSFAFHAATGDATNSNVFQNSKLHNLVLQSCYCLEVRRGVDLTTLRFAMSRAIVADLQLCMDGTGAGAHGMISKQMRNLGCPIWNDPRGASHPGVKVVDTYLYTSDQGPDQCRFRRLITAQVEHLPNTVVWTWNCQLHEGHLVVKTGMGLADSVMNNIADFKYFGMLAKIVNIWRDAPGVLFKIWVRLHGSRSAVTNARKLPPRCLSGRWGSVDGTESWLLKCDLAKLQMVFKDYLRKKSKEDDEKAAKTAREGVAPGHVENEPANDEMAEHTRKLTKWRSDVYQGLVVHGASFSKS
jgi:hypothetical protein